MQQLKPLLLSFISLALLACNTQQKQNLDTNTNNIQKDQNTTNIGNRLTLSISGQVIDSITSDGVASVKLQLGDLTESTNSSGYFSFKNIKLDKGSYTLVIKHNNYIATNKSIEVNKKDKTTAALTGIVKNKTSKAVLEGVIVRDQGITSRYTKDNKKQIVTDNMTELQWQDDSEVSRNRLNWKAAKNYCDKLSLGGYSDWRLPNITELLSITDLGRHDPAINPVFRYTSNGRYWSSSPNAWSGSTAWFVFFYYGNRAYYLKSKPLYVRCVRGKALVAPSYTRDNTKQIVTDNITELQWQDDSEVTSNKRNWQAAKNYCDKLNLGGYSDWRLPNITELLSITDLGSYIPAINPAFRHTSESWYWSSSSHVSSSNTPWVVFFYNGNSGYYHDKGKSLHVRCVR